MCKSIVAHLKDFILEFGKDFSFVGDEYRVQVGNKDFFINLLFYNRELSCLVANENSSVGLILCTDKDDTVVEYTLRRIVSSSRCSISTSSAE